MQHTNYRRFVIISPYRSGSTLLTERLNAHASIACYGELLNPKNVIWHPMPAVHSANEDMRMLDPGDFLDAVAWRNHSAETKAVGFKLPLGQFQVQFQKVRQYLGSVSNLKVIYLHRENLLARYVSYMNAGKNSKWFVFDEAERPKLPPLEIDPVHLQQTFQLESLLPKAIKASLPDCPSIEISYENLVGEPTHFQRLLCDFLGVEFQPPKDVSKRMSSGSLADRIANFDALAQHFRGTQWEVFFSEDQMPGRSKSA